MWLEQPRPCRTVDVDGLHDTISTSAEEGIVGRPWELCCVSAVRLF